MRPHTLAPARARRLLGRLRSEEGWAGTAIAYPAVVVLCLAIFQFGFYYLAGTTAESVADLTYQEARSYHATDADGIAAGAAALVTNRALLTGGHTTVTRTPTIVTVTVTGHALVMLPGLPLPEIRRTRSGPVERWVPAP